MHSLPVSHGMRYNEIPKYSTTHFLLVINITQIVYNYSPTGTYILLALG